MKTVLELLDEVYNAGYLDRQKERDYDPRGNKSYDEALSALRLKDNDSNVDFHCDLCNNAITDFNNDIYHHTGIINGKFNDHIHLCANCQNCINPPVFNFDIGAETCLF